MVRQSVLRLPARRTGLVLRIPQLESAPVNVTGVPTVPQIGLRLVMLGAEAVTVKLTALLAIPPTVTTTLPAVAPLGTDAMMLVALQLVAVAAVPLNVTVLEPCVEPKFAPAIRNRACR